MKRFMIGTAAALILVHQAGSELSAQLFDTLRPGDAAVTLMLQGGALLAPTELPDGASYKNGAALGGSLMLFPLHYFGVRGWVLSGTNEGVQPGGGQPFSAAAAHAGRNVLYGGELVARMPLAGGAYVPYLSAGPGGKSWRWEIKRPHPGRTSFAWSGAAGLNFKPSPALPVGVVVEGRYHRSHYYWHGLAATGPCCDFKPEGTLTPEPPVVNDFIFTIGVSASSR